MAKKKNKKVVRYSQPDARMDMDSFARTGILILKDTPVNP